MNIQFSLAIAAISAKYFSKHEAQLVYIPKFYHDTFLPVLVGYAEVYIPCIITSTLSVNIKIKTS